MYPATKSSLDGVQIKRAIRASDKTSITVGVEVPADKLLLSQNRDYGKSGGCIRIRSDTQIQGGEKEGIRGKGNNRLACAPEEGLWGFGG